MQILLRGKKVKTVAIAKSLSKTEVDYYRPSTLSTKSGVKIVFGFSQNKNHYGIMMYHRNRLIKPYERVGYQLKVRPQNTANQCFLFFLVPFIIKLEALPQKDFDTA